ncbi:hypothetical protein [Qingshengfaniella alkalisoli]|uniref:Uncharacterized protein n=1 Tax=Qingshengfaniella alkalisoli TaxID=2599296 RepID=A0A5B8IYJ4_9RHOB|nr:hypothetical protein [Qingshengfaniella alkalisoli]QDY71202.1 hypothetical protein FPZ52_16015 [Qingshengfaniella alkalisoli]
MPDRSPLSSILCPSRASAAGTIRISEIRVRIASAAWTRTAGSENDDVVFNKRVRALNRAIATRTVNPEALEAAQREYNQWLAKQD